MKRTFLMVCAALVALVSCEKQVIETPKNTVPVTFNLQATHPDGTGTKAVKSGWENGDIIFVIFSGVSSPYYLKITYDNGTWMQKQMNADSEDMLPLCEGDMGTMTAIFQPFAKEYTHLCEHGGTFAFSEKFMSYYMTDQLPYEVVEGEISGNFHMQIPDGFVQFFIEADDAEEGKAMLWEPHLIPCVVTGVDENGVDVIEDELDKGKPIPGFAYGGGYLFSGILDTEAQDNPVTYGFTRFMGSGNVETATTVTPRTMKPSGKTGRAADITGLVWCEQDVREAVDLGLPSGNKWANVNLGAALPTDFGAYYAWGELTPKVTYKWLNYKWRGDERYHVTKYCHENRSYYWDGGGAPDNITILDLADDAAKACWGEDWQTPSVEDFDELIAECEWIWQEGYEGTDIDGFQVKSKSSDAYIFLPAAGYVNDFARANGDNYCGYYLATSIYDDSFNCKVLYFMNGDETGEMDHGEERYRGFPIRPVWKN